MRIVSAVLPALVVALTLVGCTTDAPTPASTAGGIITSTPETVATPSPMPVATEDPESETRGDDSPLQAIDAYELCIAQTRDSFTRPDDVQFVTFDQSQVWDMQNGYWNATIDVVSSDPADAAVPSVACIVGGTIGAPVWHSFGGGVGPAPGVEVID